MAENTPFATPYAYCINNPIILHDPDGQDWFVNENTGQVFFNSEMGKNAAGTGNMKGDGWTWMGANDMFGEVNDEFFANNSEFNTGNHCFQAWQNKGLDGERTNGYEMDFAGKSSAFMSKMGYEKVPTQALEYSKSIKEITVFMNPRMQNSFDLGCKILETEKVGYVPKGYVETGRPNIIGSTLYNPDCTESVRRLTLNYSKAPNLGWIGTAIKAILGGEHNYQDNGPCMPNVDLINKFREKYGNR
jgi:hypothetical protein